MSNAAVKDIPGVRLAKEDDDISASFRSLSGGIQPALPSRFADLKREVVGNNRSLIHQSWKDLLEALQNEVNEIQQTGTAIIPEVAFADLVAEESPDSWVDEVKKRGCVVVRDVVEDDLAVKWKESVQKYVTANPHVKGFPAEDKQIFELYWLEAQLEARAHPNVLETQRSLMKKLLHFDAGAKVSLDYPMVYGDRFRIRKPGDAKFALGPHTDGGGALERWEDAGYRNCYREILAGHWKDHDSWDVGRRLNITSDMYGGPSRCGVFRVFQGWLSLSATGPTEGTLRVYPLLKEATAYVLLRPFFRPLLPAGSSSFLNASNWVLDLESPDFPNATMGMVQELNDVTHPHLKLDDGGVVSMKRVNPGDMVFWHCDGIHAVEKDHRGASDSAVFYIPVVPLTTQNVQYVERQRDALRTGAPAPDFPGDASEKGFDGEGSPADYIESVQAKRSLGLAAFQEQPGMSDGERAMIIEANSVLGY